MRNEIRSELESLAELQYRDFSSTLIPGSKSFLGVRLPILRKIAKDLVKNCDWERELEYEDEFFEEVMLRGMIIGYGTSKDNDIDKAFYWLDKFTPMVDNWSVCDSCCVSFDIFRRYHEKAWSYIQKFIYSDKEFEVRIGLIILLNHFLKYDENSKKIPRKRVINISMLNEENEYEGGKYIDKILIAVNREFNQGYYAQMAAAWLIAECMVTFPKKTYQFLKDNKIDMFTYNKALQKICESRTPDENVKNLIRALKRK